MIEAVRIGDKIEFAVDGKTYTLKKIHVVTADVASLQLPELQRLTTPTS
ncbi:hypothetical protein [Rhodoblastus sp.]|nr:hypothetical protein [Rhodoblastus sp.]